MTSRVSYLLLLLETHMNLCVHTNVLFLVLIPKCENVRINYLHFCKKSIIILYSFIISQIHIFI